MQTSAKADDDMRSHNVIYYADHYPVLEFILLASATAIHSY